MMLERNIKAVHPTIYFWVQAYALELDKRCRPYLKPTNDSRLDKASAKRFFEKVLYAQHTEYSWAHQCRWECSMLD
jgi:transposase-like protein